jgi:hypothetical protein
MSELFKLKSMATPTDYQGYLANDKTSIEFGLGRLETTSNVKLFKIMNVKR